MYSATSASRAAVSIRRAPSRANLSKVGDSFGPPVGTAAVPPPAPANVGVDSSAATGLS